MLTLPRSPIAVRRPGRMTLRRRLTVAVALAAMVGAVVGWWLRGQAQIDSCLDGGGRWNGERGYCEVVVDG